LCAGRTRVRFAFFGRNTCPTLPSTIIPENGPDVCFIAPDHKACIGVPPTASGATTDARGGTHRGNTPIPRSALPPAPGCGILCIQDHTSFIVGGFELRPERSASREYQIDLRPLFILPGITPTFEGFPLYRSSFALSGQRDARFHLEAQKSTCLELRWPHKQRVWKPFRNPLKQKWKLRRNHAIWFAIGVAVTRDHSDL